MRGEFTLVLAPIGGEETARRAAEELESQQERAAAMVAERLAAGESVSRVAKEVAAELDLAKKEVYTTALRLKEELDSASAEARPRVRLSFTAPRAVQAEITPKRGRSPALRTALHGAMRTSTASAASPMVKLFGRQRAATEPSLIRPSA